MIDDEELDRQIRQTLKKRREQVEYLLEKHPETRDNDTYLFLMWCKAFGGVEIGFIPIDKIRRMRGVLGTLRTIRQVIQNKEGRFPPSPEVKKFRQRYASRYRNIFKQKPGDEQRRLFDDNGDEDDDGEARVL